MWLHSPSLWTSLSFNSKIGPSVSLLSAPPEPLNHPLVSNEATGSSVGPNGQKPFFFVGSSLVYTLPLNITPGSRIACSEDEVVVRLLTGAFGAPIITHLLLLHVACLVAVSGRLMEQAPHRLALSSFSSLISSFALGRHPRDAGFLAVPWIAAIVTVDGAVASPGQMYGNPTSHNRGRVIWTREAVDVHSCVQCLQGENPASHSWQYGPSRTRQEEPEEGRLRTARRALAGPYSPDARVSRPWCKEIRRDHRRT